MYYHREYDLTPEKTIDYLRKSRSDDPNLTVEEVLEKHESELDDWAERVMGAKVPEENKFREVASSETIKDRPEFIKVLRLIESPKYNAVAVADLARLSRGDLEDIGRLMKIFKHTNTLICTPQRIYDLRDKYDWDAVERDLKRGNEYLEYTKEILKRGRNISLQAGNHLGRAPYGYRKIYVKEGKKKCPTLEIIPEQAEVVRMIYDMYINQNMGYIAITRRLNELGIKPQRALDWSDQSVEQVLQNIHYIGKVRWDFRKTIYIVEDGEIHKKRTKNVSECIIVDGKHEAIISEEVFNAAQEKRGSIPRTKITGGKSHLANPFAGILYCASCGRAIAYKGHFQRQAPRLLCEHQKICGTGSCQFSDIESRVISTLEECIEDFKLRVNTDMGDSIKLHKELIHRLEKKKKLLEEKELAQWEAQSDPDPSVRMPPHIFKMLNEKLLKEKEEIQEALCNAYEAMPEPVDYAEKIVRFTEALEALKDPQKSAKEKICC